MTDSKTTDWATDKAIESVNYSSVCLLSPDEFNTVIGNISQALLSAYERGRVEREWQPFTTAPEDGSVILAYRPDAGVFTAIHCEADAHLSSVMRPPEGDFSWFTTGGDDLADDMPTHWMPLPVPPAIRQLLEVKG